jgi:hypothetical protein
MKMLLISGATSGASAKPNGGPQPDSRLRGLRYDVVRRPEGQSSAERKLDELTRQLEDDMRLNSPKAKSFASSPRLDNSHTAHISTPPVTREVPDNGTYASSVTSLNSCGECLQQSNCT